MRTYAPFFEWFDKGRKELGVVEELLESLNRTGKTHLHSPRLQTPDPPDCACVNRSGGQVAVEVAEVVCQDAARLNAQGHDVMRLWNPGDLTVHIGHRLREKDKKIYHGGPYSETVACLFTDEPMLTVEQAASELGVHQFGPFGQLTSGFLVFSYDPGTKSYPVLELRFQQ
ncbi:MAG: hypothetical protein HYV00_06275 [Deltaproteobacteria bacterium]|nr:hypothetical protein [Deltaproteobacteria bacterium]